MTTTLVTGAGGFLGSRLVRELLGRPDITVRALVRREVPWLGANEVVVGDLNDADTAARATDGIETIFHLAGGNEVAARHDPEGTTRRTVGAAELLADAGRNGGVTRIVYVSTVHVYGALMTPGAVLVEDLFPQPVSAYAAARWEVEQLLAAASAPGSLLVYRLTNSVGAPVHPEVDRWTLVVNDLCRQAVTTSRLRLESDGTQWRDFVALSDVCRILTSSLDPAVIPAGTYNLGSGRPTTIRTLAGLVQRFAADQGLGAVPLDAPEPPSGPAPRPCLLATDRLARLGCAPRIPLESAVQEVLRFCITNKEALAA